MLVLTFCVQNNDNREKNLTSPKSGKYVNINIIFRLKETPTTFKEITDECKTTKSEIWDKHFSFTHNLFYNGNIHDLILYIKWKWLYAIQWMVYG